MSIFFLGEQMRFEATSNFNLRRLERGRKPIELERYDLETVPGFSVINLLVKLKQTLEPIFPADLPESLRELVRSCIAHAQDSGLPVRSRYVYLSYDSRPVAKGKTQRNPGWHFDGMQGEEIPVKQPGCYSFLWSNKLPFLYTEQSFSLSGINAARHNVFDSLATQVYEDSVCEAKSGHLYLMSCYQMHRAQVAQEDMYDRVFVRLSFSELEYTSTSMTLNSAIEQYPFKTHTTSGEIPKNLAVLETASVPAQGNSEQQAI